MLEVKNLSASYGDVKVFSDLSFEIKKGDYLVIVGENGSCHRAAEQRRC